MKKERQDPTYTMKLNIFIAIKKTWRRKEKEEDVVGEMTKKRYQKETQDNNKQ